MTSDQLSNYQLGALEETPAGFRARLTLQGTPQNRFGQDIKDLVLEVEHQTTDRESKLATSAQFRPACAHLRCSWAAVPDL